MIKNPHLCSELSYFKEVKIAESTPQCCGEQRKTCSVQGLGHDPGSAQGLEPWRDGQAAPGAVLLVVLLTVTIAPLQPPAPQVFVAARAASGQLPTQLQGPPAAVPMAQAVPTELSASPPSTHTAVLWAPASALPEGCSQNTFDLSCTSYLGAIHLLLIGTFMIQNRHRSPLAGTAQQCRQVDNTSQENGSHTEPICGWKCPKSNSFPSCHPMPQCSELTQAQAASPAAAAQEEHGLGQLVLLFKYSTCFSPIPHPHT